MLNIRKDKLDKIAVLAIYGLLIGGFPYAIAKASAEEPVQPVVQQVPVDPLEKYKGAKKLSDTDLVDLLSAVGFEGKALKVAYAVAKKESNGRPLAHNGNQNTGDNSYGIFQINMIADLGEARRDKFNLKSNTQLFDPVVNAKIAFFMTRGGEDWSSWKIVPDQNNGERYQQYLKEFAGLH
jgi:soluble lytic murein transglycosylase-like protein